MSLLLYENAVTVYRGSSKTLKLTVTDSDGDAVDLTGARIVLSAKKDISDRDPVIQKDSQGVGEVEVTSPREGKAEIYLIPEDTQNLDACTYVFDVWVVLASGERYPVIRSSELVVESGVTVLPL